jgi:hypothetical protein
MMFLCKLRVNFAQFCIKATYFFGRKESKLTSQNTLKVIEGSEILWEVLKGSE